MVSLLIRIIVVCTLTFLGSISLAHQSDTRIGLAQSLSNANIQPIDSPPSTAQNYFFKADLNDDTLIDGIHFFANREAFINACKNDCILDISLVRAKVPHNWFFALGAFQSVTIENWRDGKLISTQVGGWDYPISKEHSLNFIFGPATTHALPLNLESDRLRIHFQGFIEYRKAIPQLFCYNEDIFTKPNQLFFYLFLVSYVMLSLFLVLTYFISSAKEFIYFFGANISFLAIWLISYGYGNYFLWPNNNGGFLNDLNEISMMLFVFLHTCFYTLFMIKYLHIYSISRMLQKIAYWFLRMYLVLIVLFIFTSWGIIISLIFSLLSMPIILAMILKSLHYKSLNSTVAFYSFLALVLGSVVTIGAEMNWLDYNLYTGNAVIIGAIFELFILFGGLLIMLKNQNKANVLYKKQIEIFKKTQNSATHKITNITIQEGKKDHLINIKDIVYTKSIGNYCEIYFDETKDIIRITLKELLQLINTKKNYQFAQPNRSHIVPLAKLTMVSKTQLTIDKKTTIPISKTYRDEFLTQMQEFSKIFTA